MRIRFISNSSYWLYLVHMPLVDVLQIWVSDWGAGSEFWTKDNQWILITLKLSFVTVTSTALLLGSYFLVQYTPISTLLNGRRKRLFALVFPSKPKHVRMQQRAEGLRWRPDESNRYELKGYCPELECSNAS